MMKLNRYVAREYDKHAFVANGYMKSISIQVQINNRIEENYVTLAWQDIKPLFILKDQNPREATIKKKKKENTH